MLTPRRRGLRRHRLVVAGLVEATLFDEAVAKTKMDQNPCVLKDSPRALAMRSLLGGNHKSINLSREHHGLLPRIERATCDNEASEIPSPACAEMQSRGAENSVQYNFIGVTNAFQLSSFS